MYGMKYIILIFLLLTLSITSALEPVVVKELDTEPTWMVIENDTLYVTYTTPRTAGIMRFDINDIDNEEVVFNNFFKSSDLFIAEDFLISNLNLGDSYKEEHRNQTTKIDISNLKKDPRVASFTIDLAGICYDGSGYVYYTELDSDTISRFDLYYYYTIVPKVIYSQFENPTSVLFHNNNLWVLHDNGTKISKLSVLTADRVSTEIFTELAPISILKAEGDNFYAIQKEDNKVFKFDPDDPVPVMEYVTQFDTNAFDFELYKGDLYYTLREERKIMVLKNVVTSVEKLEYISTLISPNPTSEFVSFPTITSPTTIEIYNSSGNKILTTGINPNEEIDISSLPSGTYTIRTENNLFGRFIKLD